MDFRPREFSSKSVVVVAGVRTPFAKSGTKLAGMGAVELGVRALQEALAQAELRGDEVDHVVIGNVAQPADAANAARVIALFAGVPDSVPAVTVHRNCASGMESISEGALQIATGQAQVVAVGGTESMSQIPLMFSEDFKNRFFEFAFAKSLGKRLKAIRQLRLKSLKPIVGIECGLRDPVSGMNMGQTAERLALDFGISRKEQDEFALRSHQLAVAAKARLREESLSLPIGPGFKESLSEDIGPREGQTLEQLAKLKPYFDRKHGTVTVGNACPITDGAAMLILMEEERARAEGRKILGRIHSVCFAGCQPERMGLGPVFSSPRALKAAGKSLSEMSLVEINEAFAAQVLACLRAFESKDFAQQFLGQSEALGKIEMERLNVNGGAIALGHPVGTSGTRLVLTVLKELERRKQAFGLATLCIGGGQGGACVVESLAA
ncbi:MAG: thiolase family protein [Bradymonadales bacterium]|nr:MAG: thiolase family protein [Bradymonadales bacterium]